MMTEAMNVTERNLKLREGLGQLHSSQCMAAVAAVLMFIPLINLIALVLAIVAVVVSIMGIVKLKDVHPDYENAFAMVIGGFVLALLEAVVGDGILGSLVDIASSVVSLGQMYFILRATNFCLEEVGKGEMREKGNKAWKINVVTTVMSAALGVLLALLRSSSVLGLVLVGGIVALAVSIWGIVVYIGYLGEAKDCF